MERYYVDYFDTFDAFREGNLGDGWGIWGFWSERLFDSLDEARACRDRLNAELAEENRALGEHYGILDGAAGREIECVMRQR
jgi:hypothetical protein